jgi:dipeptide/tripeptide permease
MFVKNVAAEQVGANLAFYGVASNLVVYLTAVMHESNSTAANNTNNWNGVGYVLPLVAAFIADSYTGRYLGAVIFSMIYIVVRISRQGFYCFWLLFILVAFFCTCFLINMMPRATK